MLKKKILWIGWPAAVLITALYLAFYNAYVNPFDEDLFVIDFLTPLFTVVFLALVIALLVALARFQKEKYFSRLLIFFPLCLIFMCLMYTLVFGVSGPHYRAIRVPADLDCSSVRDGSFYIQRGNLKIVRRGDKQLQTFGSTGKTVSYEVRWLSPCEYEIISPKEQLKVKIVAVDSLGYDCHTYSGRGFTSGRQRVLKEVVRD